MILLCVSDKFYSDEKELCSDLAIVINAHILALVEAGNIDACAVLYLFIIIKHHAVIIFEFLNNFI